MGFFSIRIRLGRHPKRQGSKTVKPSAGFQARWVAYDGGSGVGQHLTRERTKGARTTIAVQNQSAASAPGYPPTQIMGCGACGDDDPRPPGKNEATLKRGK